MLKVNMYGYNQPYLQTNMRVRREVTHPLRISFYNLVRVFVSNYGRYLRPLNTYWNGLLLLQLLPGGGVALHLSHAAVVVEEELDTFVLGLHQDT